MSFTFICTVTFSGCLKQIDTLINYGKYKFLSKLYHAIPGKSHALHKRVEQLCVRAIRWADLKRKTKVTLVLYSSITYIFNTIVCQPKVFLLLNISLLFAVAI